MQVIGLPGHVIRSGKVASQLIDAKVPATVAAIRREAVRRWREAMADGLSAVQAARAAGQRRATLYRWEKQPAPRSRRPHRCRAKRWTPAPVRAVEGLRRDHPMWGKAKLGPLLRAAGFTASDSTVGRILASLVRRDHAGDDASPPASGPQVEVVSD